MTICMKCQVLFSWKNKKNILNFHLQKILPGVWSIEKINEMPSIGTVSREKKENCLLYSYVRLEICLYYACCVKISADNKFVANFLNKCQPEWNMTFHENCLMKRDNLHRQPNSVMEKIWKYSTYNFKSGRVGKEEIKITDILSAELAESVLEVSLFFSSDGQLIWIVAVYIWCKRNTRY